MKQTANETGTDQMTDTILRIEREGATEGRWPKYRFIVEGWDLGLVERTISQGTDRLAGNSRFDSWRAGGRLSTTREGAELHLIRLQTTVWNPTVPAEIIERFKAHLSR